MNLNYIAIVLVAGMLVVAPQVSFAQVHHGARTCGQSPYSVRENGAYASSETACDNGKPRHSNSNKSGASSASHYRTGINHRAERVASHPRQNSASQAIPRNRQRDTDSPTANDPKYCESPEGYFPEVKVCPGGWKPAPDSPPS